MPEKKTLQAGPAVIRVHRASAPGEEADRRRVGLAQAFSKLFSDTGGAPVKLEIDWRAFDQEHREF